MIEGQWINDEALSQQNVLHGGWNILDVIQRRQPDPDQPIEGKFFPLEGSFRPVRDQDQPSAEREQ